MISLKTNPPQTLVLHAVEKIAPSKTKPNRALIILAYSLGIVGLGINGWFAWNRGSALEDKALMLSLFFGFLLGLEVPNHTPRTVSITPREFAGLPVWLVLHSLDRHEHSLAKAMGRAIRFQRLVPPPTPPPEGEFFRKSL
jgi:hypothetical protein